MCIRIHKTCFSRSNIDPQSQLSPKKTRKSNRSVAPTPPSPLKSKKQAPSGQLDPKLHVPSSQVARRYPLRIFDSRAFDKQRFERFSTNAMGPKLLRPFGTARVPGRRAGLGDVYMRRGSARGACLSRSGALRKALGPCCRRAKQGNTLQIMWAQSFCGRFGLRAFRGGAQGLFVIRRSVRSGELRIT